MEVSDETAIARARQGDVDSFRVLVERYAPSVHRLAQRMTGSREDAEDMTQEAFMKAYRRLDDFDFRASFGTWVRCIGANCCLDLLRSRRRHPESHLDDDSFLASSSPDPERAARSAEMKRRVVETLATLTPRERAAFVLRHFEGLSIAEIGPALGLSGNGTKQSIFRAVRKIRLALGPFVASDVLAGATS